MLERQLRLLLASGLQLRLDQLDATLQWTASSSPVDKPTALAAAQHAVRRGDLESVLRLLNNHPQLDRQLLASQALLTNQPVLASALLLDAGSISQPLIDDAVATDNLPLLVWLEASSERAEQSQHLSQAVDEGRLSTVLSLLSDGAVVDATILGLAVERGNQEIFTALLQSLPDCHWLAICQLAAQLAASRGRVDMIEQLIAKGYNQQADLESMIAAIYDSHPCAEGTVHPGAELALLIDSLSPDPSRLRVLEMFEPCLPPDLAREKEQWLLPD